MKSPRMYILDEKQNAIRRALDAGPSVASREFNIPSGTLSCWVHKARQGKPGFALSPEEPAAKPADEVLLAADESQRVVWLTINAAIQCTRNGQFSPPFTSPSPVGLMEAPAGGASGTALKVLEGGLVQQVSMDILLDVLISGRQGLLNLMSRLGRGVVATVGLLPQPPIAWVDFGEEETLSLLDRLILMSADG
ncbi:MAG: transposase-like protein [Myxococcota bacterium]|jgi:transposase-like protein